MESTIEQTLSEKRKKDLSSMLEDGIITQEIYKEEIERTERFRVLTTAYAKKRVELVNQNKE